MEILSTQKQPTKCCKMIIECFKQIHMHYKYIYSTKKKESVTGVDKYFQHSKLKRRRLLSFQSLSRHLGLKHTHRKKADFIRVEMSLSLLMTVTAKPFIFVHPGYCAKMTPSLHFPLIAPFNVKERAQPGEDAFILSLMNLKYK